MSKEGHISFEDLNLEYGESMTPGSLFMFTEEENEFRMEIRKFAREEIDPLVERIDREDNVELALGIIRKLGDNYLPLAFPKEIGGLGKGTVYRMIFGEELSAVHYPTAVIYGSSCNLFGVPIIHFGTRVQQEKFLKPIMNGTALGAIGITEPTGGSDAIGGMRTTAVKKGDKYIINGEKRFITNGSIAKYILLYCKTNTEVPARKGVSAIVFPTDTPGFEVVKDFELIGRKGSVNSHLRFSDCEVPEENLIGMENEGVKIMLYGLDAERAFTGSQYLGISRSAFEVATKYSGLRRQFGREIRRFEGISFKIAEMYMKIEAGRLMLLRAARMIDQGLSATKEAGAAKCFVSDNAVQIVTDALQVLGGIGYTKEFPLERYFRDVKIAQIGAGTAEILRYLVQREIYREMDL
ncbi:MAG: acyl-CoA dehydrogenase family protein [Candidatus Helarchaeota archaeon]|nr:acyl-CoA dehydrogenase family protein [Candidatus Helarchaeota archaeon]